MGSELDGILHKTDSNGNPNVFNLEHNTSGLWLNNNWANPDNKDDKLTNWVTNWVTNWGRSSRILSCQSKLGIVFLFTPVKNMIERVFEKANQRL